jgi:hypothetical protein
MRVPLFRPRLTVATVGSIGAIAALAWPLAAQRLSEYAAEHDARSAQRAFEAFRRFRLPSTQPHGNTCEVTIGRLCYWDDNDDPPLPVEPHAIAGARRKLRATLDSAARTAPHSDWIIGQRIRYALDARDGPAADSLVRSCTATPWWCAALAGLVWHTGGLEEDASRAFALALRTMPDTLRCAWLDIRLWLPSDARRLVKHASCEAHARVADRLFWLAAPLLTWHADAARNEWLARHTMARLTEGTALPSGLSWGDDVVETSLRFGWPSHWAREDQFGTALDPLNVPVVGHEATPSWSFVPAAHALAAPEHAAPGDWVLSGTVAPPMRYAPGWLREIAPLTVQLARFRRDSAMRVVAAYEVADTTFADSIETAVPAALVAATPEGAATIMHGPPGKRYGALLLTARPTTGIVAVELVDSAHARAARWRSGIAPIAPDALVSDLLIGRAGAGPIPSTLDAALPLAVASLRFPEGSTLALYWECYASASPDHPFTVTLRLVPQRASFGSRLAHAFGFGHRGTPISMRWTDVGTGRADSTAGRSLRLALPNIAPGRYRLELVVAGNAAHGRATRELEITRREQ